MSTVNFEAIVLRKQALDKIAICLHHSRSKFCIAWIFAKNQPNRVLTDPVGFLLGGRFEMAVLVLFVSASLNSNQ